MEKLYEKVRIGRPPTFPTAADLWEKALEYFAWCDDNPVKISVKEKKRNSQKNGTGDENQFESVPKPYTLDGLCLWCNILVPWATFKRDQLKRQGGEDFSIVLNACEKCVRDQQVTGAMIGLYSERLTARLNGISEKVEQVIEERATMTWEDVRAKMVQARESVEKDEK